MVPSIEEINKGQRAYQSIKKYERNKRGIGFGIFILGFFGLMIFDAFHREGFSFAVGTAIFWGTAIGISYWQYRNMEKKAQQALVILEALKSKYGREVYSIIQKEPRSWSYRIFQKIYPPSRQPSVKLP
jgi:hypothetical protein